MRNLLRNPWRIGWLLAAWLLLALSLGALSDCLADRPPPPPLPRATATPVPEVTPVPIPSLFAQVCAGRPVNASSGWSATVGIGLARVPPGQRALVPITITDVTNPRGLAGYNMCIVFDPAVVQLVSITGGDPPFAGAPVFNINNTEGWVSMNAIQATTLNGPRGPITVAHLEVEVIGAWGAFTTLALQVRDLIDPYGDSMAATEVNGEVRVR